MKHKALGRLISRRKPRPPTQQEERYQRELRFRLALESIGRSWKAFRAWSAYQALASIVAVVFVMAVARYSRDEDAREGAIMIAGTFWSCILLGWIGAGIQLLSDWRRLRARR